VGGVPEGTVTVGAVPAVPAGERSAAGIDPIDPLDPLDPLAVVVVDDPSPVPPDADVVVVVFEAELDGEELQAASPRAAPRPSTATSALERRGWERRGMARNGSRWPLGRQITPLT
jgi:hypothetical protein